MRITFLMPWANRLGGTERAVTTQMNHLARRHSVRLLAVLRPRGRGFPLDRRVTRTHLVDLRGRTTQTASGVDYGGPDAVDELLAAPSEPFGQSAGRAFNRLTDLELEHALRHVSTDVLVTTAPPLLTLAARFAPSTVLLVHQEHRASEHRRGQEQLLLESAPRADAVVSLTGESRDWLAESLGSSAPRLEVIPDALAVARPPRSLLTERLVVTAGRLVPEKRYDDLIRAFADVVAPRPDWRLRIFGDGPAEDGLRRLIDELGLHNHVLLPGGTPFPDREWAKASIGVLSSRSEGLGLSLIEAAAAGVPSVSYDSPNGPSTVVADGENGRLVPVGDVDALAEGLLGLIDDDSERRRLGEAAGAAARRYAPDAVLPRWDALVDALWERRSRRNRLTARLGREANRARETAALAATAWPGSRSEPKASPAGLAALQALRPDLIEDAGRLWHRLDRLPERHARLQALDLVVDVLEREGIDYFWMRSSVTTVQRIGVLVKERGRVLRALASAYGNEGVYVTALLGANRLGEAVLAGAIDQHPEVHDAPALRVNRYAMSPGRTLRFGIRYACDIELWEDRGDALVPCRPGVNADEAIPAEIATPSSVTLGGQTYRSVAVFTRRTVDDIDFPIDAVYTWVDDSDPAWQERKRAELERQGADMGADAALASRFRSRDELRYSLRSLALYAPWIRHVYLVTDRQIPAWLDVAHPDLTVVDHTEIFPFPDRLPIFNSHALESSLHHIDGLADHYLYINDDVLFGRPVRPQLFFSSNGLAHFFVSQARISAGPVDPCEEPHFSARKNTRRLLEDAFGRTITHTFKHTPIPQLRPLMFELEERFADAFAHNSVSKFRNHRDYSLATTLHHYYGYLTGRTVPAGIRYGYFNADNLSHHRGLEDFLMRRDRDVFCVNDGPGDEVSHEEQERMLRRFFDAYLPLASSFERADSSDASSVPRLSRQSSAKGTKSTST